MSETKLFFRLGRWLYIITVIGERAEVERQLQNGFGEEGRPLYISGIRGYNVRDATKSIWENAGEVLIEATLTEGVPNLVRSPFNFFPIIRKFTYVDPDGHHLDFDKTFFPEGDAYTDRSGLGVLSVGPRIVALVMGEKGELCSMNQLVETLGKEEIGFTLDGGIIINNVTWYPKVLFQEEGNLFQGYTAFCTNTRSDAIQVFRTTDLRRFFLGRKP